MRIRSGDTPPDWLSGAEEHSRLSKTPDRIFGETAARRSLQKEGRLNRGGLSLRVMLGGIYPSRCVAAPKSLCLRCDPLAGAASRPYAAPVKAESGVLIRSVLLPFSKIARLGGTGKRYKNVLGVRHRRGRVMRPRNFRFVATIVCVSTVAAGTGAALLSARATIEYHLNYSFVLNGPANTLVPLDLVGTGPFVGSY